MPRVSEDDLQMLEHWGNNFRAVTDLEVFIPGLVADLRDLQRQLRDARAQDPMAMTIDDALSMAEVVVELDGYLHDPDMKDAVIATLAAEVRRLRGTEAELREALTDMCHQFAYDAEGDDGPALYPGGLSALEWAFDALGWDELHPMPELTCDEPGCKVRARCWRGKRQTCAEHFYRLDEAARELPEEGRHE